MCCNRPEMEVYHVQGEDKNSETKLGAIKLPC